MTVGLANKWNIIHFQNQVRSFCKFRQFLLNNSALEYASSSDDEDIFVDVVGESDFDDNSNSSLSPLPQNIFGTSSGSSERKNRKKVQFCQRCVNHEEVRHIKGNLKFKFDNIFQYHERLGHKKQCPYNNCTCEKCILVGISKIIVK